MRIIAISDTHTYGKQIVVPDGDLLIHSGDHTFKGTEKEIKRALAWLDSLPHKVKILISGNHDWYFDPNAPNEFRGWRLRRYYSKSAMLAKFPTLTYLCDEAVVVNGLVFYGSPWTLQIPPPYGPWAFNFAGGEKGRHQAQNTWAKIPEDVNVLITHTPPKGILDRGHGNASDGCPMLRKRLDELPKLRLHVFGHLHDSYGRRDYETRDGEKLTFVNAAINTDEYKPTNAPIVVDL